MSLAQGCCWRRRLIARFCAHPIPPGWALGARRCMTAFMLPHWCGRISATSSPDMNGMALLSSASGFPALGFRFPLYGNVQYEGVGHRAGARHSNPGHVMRRRRSPGRPPVALCGFLGRRLDVKKKRIDAGRHKILVNVTACHLNPIIKRESVGGVRSRRGSLPWGLHRRSRPTPRYPSKSGTGWRNHSLGGLQLSCRPSRAAGRTSPSPVNANEAEDAGSPVSIRRACAAVFHPITR